jgi:hypothetical protein
MVLLRKLEDLVGGRSMRLLHGTRRAACKGSGICYLQGIDRETTGLIEKA